MQGDLIDIRQVEILYRYYLTEIPKAKQLLATGIQQYNDMCDCDEEKSQMHNALEEFNERIKLSEKSFDNIKRIRLELYN